VFKWFLLGYMGVIGCFIGLKRLGIFMARCGITKNPIVFLLDDGLRVLGVC
jgi:hypothetical protein